MPITIAALIAALSVSITSDFSVIGSIGFFLFVTYTIKVAYYTQRSTGFYSKVLPFFNNASAVLY